MTLRKGYNRRADIPAELLDRLNRGIAETVTLAEGLAIDFECLMHHAFPEVQAGPLDPSQGVTQRMAQAGQRLFEHLGDAGLSRAANHASDTVRGWAAFAIGAQPDWSLAERLARVRPLADDPHFGVREWAWLAMRPHLIRDLPQALDVLAAWVHAPSANVRRFAIEATRPRGVWCAHLAPMKATPELGLGLLEPVRADASRYVQDSVANWLNDAGKSRPDWVLALCDRWQSESPGLETARICRRALRNLSSKTKG